MRKTILFSLSLTLGLWLVAPLGTEAASETTAELVALLESDASTEEKALACRKLGERGTAEAVPALASLLLDEVLGTYARQGLERIPDPSAAAALRAALPTTEGALRVGVITSLGALRDENAVEALTALIGDEDAAVARAALLALGRVATPEAIQVVRKALAPARDGAASAALVAAGQLASQGHRDVAIDLYDAVRHADVSSAERVGATRGAIVTRGSVPFLMEQLDSADEAIRGVALLAIREMPSPALATALHARLAKASPDLQVLLITALADCSNDETFAVLRPYLDDQVPAIRKAALATVSAVGDGPELAAALLDVVSHHRSGGETQTALDLLERMEGGAAIDEVVLARLGDTDDVDVRVDMIRVLGERRSGGAVDDLLALARGGEPRVRVAALRSMRRVVGPAEVPALIAVVEAERDDTVRAAAIAPLVSACGDDPAAGELVLAELKQATDPGDHDVWTRVITAVGYPGALPTVQAGLEDDDPEVVAYTANRLADWPDPAPIDSLLTVMEASTEPEVRRRTCAAVIQLTMQAAEEQQRPDDVLVGWFERASAGAESVQQKRQLVSGLARVHTLDSLRVLEPYLQDPGVVGEAQYALLSIGSPLARAGHGAEVARVLPEEAAVEDDDLRWRFRRLRAQIEDAE